MKRIQKIILSFILLPGIFSMAIFASADDYIEYEDVVRVLADGWEYDGKVIEKNDTAYVSLREFACMADNSVVSWDEDSRMAYVTTDSLELSVSEENDYIEANGRALWCENGVFTIDGTLFVPLGKIAKAFGFGRSYSAAEHTTYLVRERASIESADEYYDEEELYWMAKIINAESGGEPFLGKIAVGNVILNRVESDEFPDSIYSVIFDNKNGVQFTPTVNGAINKEPNEESVLAAKICLEDSSLSDDILYFLNEDLAESKWIVENCRYVMTIGGHDFYA